MPEQTFGRAVAAVLRAETARRDLSPEDIVALAFLWRSKRWMRARWSGTTALTIDELAAWCRALELSLANVLDAAWLELQSSSSPQDAQAATHDRAPHA